MERVTHFNNWQNLKNIHDLTEYLFEKLLQTLWRTYEKNYYIWEINAWVRFPQDKLQIDCLVCDNETNKALYLLEIKTHIDWFWNSNGSMINKQIHRNKKKLENILKYDVSELKTLKIYFLWDKESKTGQPTQFVNLLHQWFDLFKKHDTRMRIKFSYNELFERARDNGIRKEEFEIISKKTHKQ